MLQYIHKDGYLIKEFNKKNLISFLSIFVIWLFVVSALIGIALGYEKWFIPKTPLNLLIGFGLLILNVPVHTKKAVLMLSSAFIIGMLVEIAGVSTGEIFGNYYYGNNLGIKYLGVPIIIGIYWAVLTISSSMIARKLFRNIWLVSLVGAGLMVGLDFVMEIMAGTYDFWHFEGGHPPLANYVAWFIVAFFLNLLCFENVEKGGESFSFHLWFSQLTFFIVSFFLITG